jgi:3-phosphoshikimate 1-carboxyvinyltransferase
VIHVPPSKSYANRALILGALKKSVVTVFNLPEASDVTFLVEAFKQIGLEIHHQKSQLAIHGCFPLCEPTQGAEIDVGEGGTTARFLACLLTLGSAPYTLVLGQRLKQRPWDEFIQLVQSLGGKARLVEEKLFIQGPIHVPQELKVDCQRTTQFASGFELALAFKDCKIIPTHLASSQSYWSMTDAVIQHFIQYDEYTVPTDWSSASFPMAFGALKQDIFFPGLKPDSLQADSKFFDLLNSMKAVTETPEGLRVHLGKLTGSIVFDCSDCLDLVPALSFYLAHIEGRHELQKIENLIHKESDRLQQVLSLLTLFHVQASSDGQTLWIEGKKNISSTEVNLALPDDHRMVMAGALFLRFHQGGKISPVSAVSKSYPRFFELLSKE